MLQSISSLNYRNDDLTIDVQHRSPDQKQRREFAGGSELLATKLRAAGFTTGTWKLVVLCCHATRGNSPTFQVKAVQPPTSILLIIKPGNNATARRCHLMLDSSKPSATEIAEKLRQLDGQPTMMGGLNRPTIMVIPKAGRKEATSTTTPSFSLPATPATETVAPAVILEPTPSEPVMQATNGTLSHPESLFVDKPELADPEKKLIRRTSQHEFYLLCRWIEKRAEHLKTNGLPLPAATALANDELCATFGHPISENTFQRAKEATGITWKIIKRQGKRQLQTPSKATIKKATTGSTGVCSCAGDVKCLRQELHELYHRLGEKLPG